MRVSESFLYHQAQQGVSRSREEYARASEESSSGLKVEHAWDAPADTGLIMQQSAESEREQAVASAAGRAADEATFADSALGSINNALQRAEELAVQLSNDTYSAQDRGQAASEAAQLLQQVVSQGNARFGDVYVFAGFKTGLPPFDAKGNYAGDGNVRQVEIAPGVTQRVAVAGDAVLKGAGGGVDIPAALASFVTALSTNNLAGIQQGIDDFAQAVNQVANARSTLGGSQDVFTAAVSAAQSHADSASKAKSSLQDADVFDSSTRLAAAEQALQATITSTAKQISAPTLAQKL